LPSSNNHHIATTLNFENNSNQYFDHILGSIIDNLVGDRISHNYHTTKTTTALSFILVYFALVVDLIITLIILALFSHLHRRTGIFLEYFVSVLDFLHN